MLTLHNVLAPAKLNLFLHITGRRDDGYHLLQSVFMLIDWCDTLHFDTRTDGQLIREDLTVPLPADDLVLRAAKALQSASGTTLGAHIAIEKTIPAQAGMGGGSSDAASTLLALNRLWQLNWPLHRLLPIGLSLGADVPFFLGGGNAFVEGVGEQLTPIQTPERWFVLIHPGVSVPTPLIFQSPELTRDSKVVKIADFSDRLPGFGRNDLQAVAARAFPPVADALDWLSHRADARMTGSGAGVFASFASESDAAATLQQVPDRWRAWKAKALALHPMAHLLPS